TAAVPPTSPSVQYATTTAYDALNRPTGVSWSPAPAAAAPSASSVTFGHSYNKVNQRIGQTVTDNSWLNYPAASPTVSYTGNALRAHSGHSGIGDWLDGFKLGHAEQDRLSALWQERRRHAVVRVYRPADRSRDRRAVLLSGTALFAGVGEIFADRPDWVCGW